MMNTSEVAIRCGEHAFTRLQKLLPQQDRLLPKIYQTEDDQYIIYWDSIHWFESSDKREAELVRAFNRAFDYLEECPFDQEIYYLDMTLNLSYLKQILMTTSIALMILSL